MMTELTDKELDAVSGGSVITASAINQQNFLSQIGVAAVAASALAGSAVTVAQGAVQTNVIN
jgi:lactobin A/cerein 7B family class IIb bacteriocin